MKRTKLRRFLPILLTLLTVIVCTIGITAMANEEADPHTNQITHASLVLDNDVDLVFWADISSDNAEESSTFMTFNGGDPVYHSGTRQIGDATYYIFKYKNIAPQDLTDVVSAQLVVNGVSTSTLDYSVKNYCQYILTNTTSASLKALISDLLVYGAAAQELYNEDAANYVTNGIVGLSPSATPNEMKVVHENKTSADLSRDPTASLDKTKLFMENGVLLDFDVILPDDADPSEYTVCMSLNGREQESRLLSDLTFAGYYNHVAFKGIYCYELFDEIQVNVYKKSVRVSHSQSLSVASYLESLSKDPEYTKIAQSFYNFCYSAHLYAGTHTVVMPGRAEAQYDSSEYFDHLGTLTYECSLCGEDMKVLEATQIRNFEGDYPNGNVANTVDRKTLFTITNETESIDGKDNKYLSIIRDTATNLGSGGFGYYLGYDEILKPNVSEGTFDENDQYTGKQFTLSMDVKAPAAGLANIGLNLRNDNGTSANNNRFLKILDINPDGSLTYSGAKITPHSAITSKEWTTITLTMERYEDEGAPYIYVEYFINDTLMSAFSVPNTLLNGTFTDVHWAIDTKFANDKQGILFDNLVLAQGCVHSFSEDVETYLAKQESGNLRQLIDKVQNDFDIEQFSYVVRWAGSISQKNYITETYKEKQGFVTLPSDKYADPPATPKSYEHPRLLFTSSDIPAILSNMEDPANAGAKTSFMNLVNSGTDGKLQSTSSIKAESFEWTNYNVSVLRAIEAKAFYYAIYKDSEPDARLRGYQAIYAMKNYMLTLDIQWKASDQCRYYGDVMYYAALVYDWCYDLLTDDDKDQFRLGVQNLLCDGTNNMPWKNTNGTSQNTHEGRKLEGGFPALGVEVQGRLTGHGSEAQVLRDYFAFAIAIYDEDTSWYDYVGGMIYEGYIEPRNYFYSSGFYPDGSMQYNSYRFICDLYNAWIFKSIGVEFPYHHSGKYTDDVPESDRIPGMDSVVHGLVAMETIDGFQFSTGDGTGTSSWGQDRIKATVADAALISSYLFDDNVALAIAYRFREYIDYFSTSQLGISAANYIILTSNKLTPAENYREKIKNVEYHGGFQQQIIARNSDDANWDSDAAVVLMQGAQQLPGGHTHQNAGSFQIWYKGMLTRDDGLYDAYGSVHHFYYHMSATAHNTLLIYNNNLATSKPQGSFDGYYYNGGQKYVINNVPNFFDGFAENPDLSFGNNIGYQTDDPNNPSYVYFGNDITNAYDKETADYVERSFMTLYTGDEETPMVMFIYDNITADRKEFQKTFLLQCATAPKIEKQDNKAVITVDNGQGKMVLTSLMGADTVKAYGRTSKNGIVMDDEYFKEYYLTTDKNGKNPGDDGYIETKAFNYTNEYGAERFYLSGALNDDGTHGKNLGPGGASMIGDRNTDLSIVWGHVEIQPQIKTRENQLMNVIYVSDSGVDVNATPTLIEGTYLTGATFKNYTSMFLNDPMMSSEVLSFTSSGDVDADGNMTYYIGGLRDGKWTVYIDGIALNSEDAKFEVTESGRMLTFKGPTGNVVLEPDNSDRPEGHSYISYNLDGGVLPEDAPKTYKEGEVLDLSDIIPTKAGSTFAGWFKDNQYINEVTAIPADAKNTFVLYAKWITPIAYVDYTTGGSMGMHNQVSYSIEAAGGTTWDMAVDGKLNFFKWTNAAVGSATGKGSIIGKTGAFSNYAAQSTTISYTLSIGRHGTDPLLPFQIYIRDEEIDSGQVGRFINSFYCDTNGNVYLGCSANGANRFDQVASTGMSTYRLVMDYSGETLKAYNDNGELLLSKTFKELGFRHAEKYDSFLDWFKTASHSNNSMFSMKGDGFGTIRVYGIRIEPGDISGDCKNYGPNSTMHNFKEIETIYAPSDTDCRPGSKLLECTECGLEKEAPIPSKVSHYSITHQMVVDKMVYTCGYCGCSFTPDFKYIINGSSYDGIVGVGNAEHYATKEGSNQPAINNGAYELLNKTGENGNLELWIPGKAPMFSGFSSTNAALGFLSFKVNARTTNNFSFNFVDTSVSSKDADKWSDGWCMTESFFKIAPPKETENGATVRITGWDNLELANVELRDVNSFTGWIDVSIYIQLVQHNDAYSEIILHYYIGGEHVGTVAKKLTTKTNAINSICITGSTASEGSGIKLDDIIFGFTANGTWVAPVADDNGDAENGEVTPEDEITPPAED